VVARGVGDDGRDQQRLRLHQSEHGRFLNLGRLGAAIP